VFILIPVDGMDEKLSKITTIANYKKWALVDFDNGKTKEVSFYENKDDIKADFIDFIILKNKFENYLDFMNEGIMVLIIREEETIEDIMEAFKFKELDEAGL